MNHSNFYFFQNVVKLSAPHVDSFNFFLKEGLNYLSDINPIYFKLLNEDRISISVQVHGPFTSYML